jgi:hypothetical protein
MTATTTAQYQPGDRVAFTSRWTRKSYTGTVERQDGADTFLVEQDPQPGDTHRGHWSVPAGQLRPIGETVTVTLPKPMDHLRKTPRTRSAKPGRFDSVTRRLHNLRKVAARVNTDQHTAAGYLAAVLHTDAAFVKSYSSPFGRAEAKAYREQYGTDPAKSGLDVRGHRLVRVYAYTVAVLQKAAATYARTAALTEVA